MYLSVATRPAIAYSVSVLSQYNENPKQEHWGAAKKVFRYLRGSSDKKLIFEGPLDKIVGYSDADHGSDEDVSRSYTGSIFKLGGAAISWKSKKQRAVSISSTEAEYRALTEATKESEYLRGLLIELNISSLSDGLIYCDNQSAIQLTTATKSHDRSKHVRIHFHYVQKAVKDQSILLLHINSDENVADILTKALPGEKQEKFTKALGVKNRKKFSA
ncbi:uncharacterized protein LOC128668194 [Microplitis demolitor]|uniref:uncharacterized protein LOC128668194 n=1 Tax=Microplitis demolitor TaxID=69319 RepID=UPI00235B7034|nr:uncharacterized protein LOC128668194 [Microplitis demolitor]